MVTYKISNISCEQRECVCIIYYKFYIKWIRNVELYIKIIYYILKVWLIYLKNQNIIYYES